MPRLGSVDLAAFGDFAVLWFFFVSGLNGESGERVGKLSLTPLTPSPNGVSGGMSRVKPINRWDYLWLSHGERHRAPSSGVLGIWCKYSVPR